MYLTLIVLSSALILFGIRFKAKTYENKLKLKNTPFNKIKRCIFLQKLYFFFIGLGVLIISTLGYLNIIRYQEFKLLIFILLFISSQYIFIISKIAIH
jgi:hypothetical protein